MSYSWLIEAVEMEGFGRGGVVASALGDVQVTGVFDGRDDRGADGGQVRGPAAGPAGDGVAVSREIVPVAVSWRQRVILMAWRTSERSRRLTWAVFRVPPRAGRS
jgi:hypothetical protein